MDISEITNSSEVGSFSINQNFLKPKIYKKPKKEKKVKKKIKSKLELFM